MENQLYDAMFTRRSVRKLRDAPLPGQTLAEVAAFLREVRPLACGAELAVVDGGKVAGGLFGIKARHCVVAYAPQGRAGMLEAGYRLQQVDLFLSAKGLGACYQGMAKARGEAGALGGMPSAMVLAFGEPAQQARRTAAAEFDRRTLADICCPALAPELMEAVRLAPSAMNSQPWYFDGTMERAGIWKRRAKGVKALALGGLNELDMGIALLHLTLAAEHLGKQVAFDFEAAPPAGADKDMEWIGAAHIR